MAKVLIVDDEENVRKVLSIQLRRMGHEATEAENGKIAWDLLKKEPFAAVITDLKMPEVDGLELLGLIRKGYPQIPVIMMTAHGTIDTAVEAMKLGAFDYITKPFNQDEFLKTIERAVLSSESMGKEFQRSRSFLRQEEKIIGATDEMEKVYSVIERVANTSSNVLITGEAGTGKEVVARLLHDKSERRTFPLVRAYVSACPVNQQMDNLFGYDSHPGWFELAEGGSIYFDEIGALSLDAQAQVYDALTSGVYKRGSEEKRISCRVIASTDFNLLEKIENGGFRKDLFYCLNVVPIYLPALRERTQDIEPLVDHFVGIFSKKFKKTITGVDDEAIFHLIQYPWPGNIRELENCIEYAVNVADKPLIKTEHLPPHLFSAPVASRANWEGAAKDSLHLKVEALERTVVENALKSSHGDILKASQKLGVPPSLLEEKVLALKIPVNPS
jgi:two-component system response regulator AtoC